MLCISCDTRRCTLMMTGKRQLLMLLLLPPRTETDMGMGMGMTMAGRGDESFNTKIDFDHHHLFVY